MASQGGEYLQRDHVGTVVVGSGFGGAVAACRLAQAGLDVAVLERGRRWPPGTFPRRLRQVGSGWLWRHRHGLYDVCPIADLVCVHAAGWGGGSLIYANVAMRPGQRCSSRLGRSRIAGTCSTRTTISRRTFSSDSRAA